MIFVVGEACLKDMDINFKDQAKGMLSKHTLDAGFGQFFKILSWVCWKRDVYFARVNPDYTSQTSSNCGVHTGTKDLSERIHKCLECGFEVNRDITAAMVISNPDNCPHLQY